MVFVLVPIQPRGHRIERLANFIMAQVRISPFYVPLKNRFLASRWHSLAMSI